MLTHIGQGCSILIPSGHNNKEFIDALLHKVFVSSKMFRGRGGHGLQKLFRKNLHDDYELQMDNLNSHEFDIPIDFYINLSEAADSASENQIAEIPLSILLYLSEFHRLL